MYQALYRKWRPATFDDVISQPHITTTLRNQLQSGKTAHAYLFTGSRGTGKTTCARIFARAINCEHPTDGNPCCSCGICEDAENFALADIIEIDAASNNGVDDIRDLRDGAVYTPERCRYKIYIIDEVHMLSASAFNALLKIMEEPPAFVKFILATTEIHKVPATIASRCQRFDFRRILPQDTTERLLYIAAQESFTLTEDAAQLIAKLSDGGMRDALSLLDQCAAYANDITVDTVTAAAGIAGRDAIFSILEAISVQDSAGAIAQLDALYAASKDVLRLCEELITQLRNLMLLHVTGDSALLACAPEEEQRLRALMQPMPLPAVLDKLTALQSCNERLMRAMNPRVELELCLIRLCQTAQNMRESLDNSEICGKINKLERMIAELSAAQNTSYRPIPQRQMPKAEPEQGNEPKADLSKMKLEDFKPIPNWAEILADFAAVDPAVSGTLVDSTAKICQNVVLIFVKNPLFMQLFKQKEHSRLLGECIGRTLGFAVAIRAKCDAPTQVQSPAEALLERANNSHIETAVE